jgi:integrase
MPLWLPLPSPVLEAVAAVPPHNAITLCANSRGRPWTVSGFRASWRPIRQRLEEAQQISPGLTLKGLRHTVATILSEMGYDERTIADMLAQKTTEMARHYSRRADKTRKLSAVVANFDAEVNRPRTKVVKPV